MIYFMKSGNQRFELLQVQLVADQNHVPEDISNLAQGFYLMLQFTYTTELEFQHRTFQSFDDSLECNFHVQLSQLYTSQNEDSLPAKLLANLSRKDLPEDVQKTMTNIIVDITKSIACTTAYPGYKVEPILVQIGIVKVVCMQDTLYRSSPVKLRIEEGSLIGEECVICLEEFLGEGEVVVMPCSHVYHKNCITKWLQTSDHCPTCSFTLQPS